MTRMERRRRRRRILRIKLATTAAVLALTTASIVALTGGAAETVPEQTPQPPALQAEPVLLVAEHDSTYQPVQMTAEPAQEPEPVEEEDENEKIEAALLEQGYLHEEIPLDFDLQCHLITVCEEYGVPQSVALGVIQAESSFTATASNGSCYGYMQINSINSEWLSEKIGVTDLTDPYQNIRSGVFILSDLYGGDHRPRISRCQQQWGRRRLDLCAARGYGNAARRRKDRQRYLCGSGRHDHRIDQRRQPRRHGLHRRHGIHAGRSLPL